MSELLSPIGDPLGLNIDVRDLEEDWIVSAPERVIRCAACGHRIPEDEIPLLLWRRGNSEMLVLHFDCARLRMVSVGERN
jgi:hypothetical protein